MTTVKQITDSIAEMLEQKEAAYGNAYDKSEEYLKLLYPGGIKPCHYRHLLFQVRIFDKLMRIANNKDAFGEEPYKDIAGYGTKGYQRELKEKQIEEHQKIINESWMGSESNNGTV